jgi:cytochrome o ubiquinol oxidase subunit 1
VAHFHSNVIGGVLFGVFCGLGYWFSKFTGFKLNERIGRQAFWCWIIGFCLSFIPMYALGLMGATRRLDHYEASTGWQPLFVLMLIGGCIIVLGTILQIVQIFASIIQRHKLYDPTGDPWDGRSLEFATVSPPPFYNFTVIPKVKSFDTFWETKHHEPAKPAYEDIMIPKNTAAGIYISIFAFLVGFGFVWEMVGLVIVSLIGIIVVFIIRGFDENSEYVLTAAEVERLEKQRSQEHEKRLRLHQAAIHEEEMGVLDFSRHALNYGRTILRKKRRKQL